MKRPDNVDLGERLVTHKSATKVAQLMGYTLLGLEGLCNRVWNEWVCIGITRKGERVNARRPEYWACDDQCDCSGRIHGKLEFSIGEAAYALTPDAEQRRRIRQEISDTVVRNIRRQASGIVAPVEPTIETASVTREISPLAPRDHK